MMDTPNESEKLLKLFDDIRPNPKVELNIDRVCQRIYNEFVSKEQWMVIDRANQKAEIIDTNLGKYVQDFLAHIDDTSCFRLIVQAEINLVAINIDNVNYTDYSSAVQSLVYWALYDKVFSLLEEELIETLKMGKIFA